MRFFPSFLFSLVSVFTFGQQGEWQLSYPKPQGNTLSDVHFVNNTTGWMVGTYGTIMKTTDGGTGWVLQSPNDTATFRAVRFVSTLSGWVVGNNGVIMNTTDGGNTWHIQASGTTEHLYDVSFVDSLTGWAISRQGILLKTTNGGVQWTAQALAASYSYQRVQFITADTGWVIQLNRVLRTTDGGQSWQNQSTPTSFPILEDLQFTDTHRGWVCGDSGRIYKTTDGGVSWQSMVTNISEEPFVAISFKDANTGIAVIGDGYTLKTINGGQTWQSAGFYTANFVFSAQLRQDGVGWMVGQVGRFWRLNGLTWEPLGGGFIWSARSVHFIDEQVGWVAGDRSSVWNTVDGGQTWQIRSILNIDWKDVYFADAQRGWILGSNEKILRTTNGGQTWIPQTVSDFTSLHSMHFMPDGLTGWIAGSSGKSFKTTDGGLTWVLKPIGATGGWYSMHFTDALNGWMVGSGGNIMHTEDGGETWQPQTSGTTYDLMSVHFVNTQTGWAVGGRRSSSSNIGIVLKTTNGGLTWTLQHQEPRMLYGLLAKDTAHLWVSGYSGTNGQFWESIDGGQQWIQKTHSTKAVVYGLGLSPGGRCWAVGSNGCFFYTDGSGCTETATLSVTGSLSVCEGQSVQLEATSGTAYQWFKNGQPLPNSVNQTLSAASSGSYTALVVFSNGCTDTTNVMQVTVNPAPLITLQPQPQSLEPGQAAKFFTEATGTAIAYQWQADEGTGYADLTNAGQYTGVFTDTLTVSELTVANNGQIFRCVLRIGNCMDTSASASLFVTTGVAAFQFSEPALYPNPAEEWVQLKTEHPIQAVSVTDAVGRVVAVCQAEPVEARLNISALRPGIYQVRIQTDEGTAVQRVVKK